MNLTCDVSFYKNDISKYSNIRLSFVDLRWAQLYVSLVIFLFFQQVLGSRWLMVDTKQVYYGMPHRMVTWCKSQYRRMKRKSGVMSCRALCAVQQGLHCSLLSLHTWPEVIRGHGAVDIRESRPLYKEMPIAPSVQWAPYMEPVASN